MRPFLSYAVYAVKRDAACPVGGSEGAGGDDDDCTGEATEYGDEDVFEKSDDNGSGAGAADGVAVACTGVGAGEAVLLEPKRPRISSMVDLGCVCVVGWDDVVVGADEPNISASRSWFD